MSTNPRAAWYPGIELSRREIILCGKERAAPQYWRAALVDPVALGWVRPNHSFLEHEAAVEAPFAGLDHAIGIPGEFVEGKTLDSAHRQMAALRSVDLMLHLGLHGRDLVGFADDFHSQSGLVDKGI